MKILQELFGNLVTFSSYAPGVETNIDLQDLQPSGESARKRVETILSVSVLKAILELQDDTELKEALRTAIANFTMAQQLVFDSIARRKNDVDVYKYEIEAMRRSYMENYYALQQHFAEVQDTFGRSVRYYFPNRPVVFLLLQACSSAEGNFRRTTGCLLR